MGYVTPTENGVKIVRTSEYFGGCPECGHNSGYLNFGREHWGICAEHRTKWLIGSNLFSSWQDESTAQHRENGVILDGYRQVTPLYPERVVYRPAPLPKIDPTEDDLA